MVSRFPRVPAKKAASAVKMVFWILMKKIDFQHIPMYVCTVLDKSIRCLVRSAAGVRELKYRLEIL